MVVYKNKRKNYTTDDELLQILQQLDPAACASRGRWEAGGRKRKMSEIDARTKAIGIISGGRVQALEYAGKERWKCW